MKSAAMNQAFVLEDFQTRPAFSSFLPGIAGPLGIPMWVFYVNRGQCISGFGLDNKDNPIMEFYPANKEYQQTQWIGFRTFLKVKQGDQWRFYEPFGAHMDPETTRYMHIDMNGLEIRETAPKQGIRTDVRYFILPDEPLAGLCRSVTITNISSREMETELLDGLPIVIPAGVKHGFLKEMSNLVQAWMGVEFLPDGTPFFRNTSSIEDSSAVELYTVGNYYFTILDKPTGNQRVKAIVDPSLIFGEDTAFHRPEPFIQTSLDAIYSAGQTTRGRTPCAFFGASSSLEPLGRMTMNSIVGQAANPEILVREIQNFTENGYFDRKYAQAHQLTLDLTQDLETHTSDPNFDQYCRQAYLDNGLRGGFPTLLGGDQHQHVLHLYSRKHGDPEREYNYFSTQAQFYSQGNGNFRDVNQNRRSDACFQSEAGYSNLKLFVNLLQVDGYNPLVVKGSIFHFPEAQMGALLERVNNPQALRRLLGKPFTPGQLLFDAMQLELVDRGDAEDFVNAVMNVSEEEPLADHGEGFWVDHWTYILDLIESFRHVFPERWNQVLFDLPEFSFYDNAHTVKPRSEKYKEIDGVLRQYDAVALDQTKQDIINSRQRDRHCVRNETGEIVFTSLFTKLMHLAVIKFATLDSAYLGIEMEADKPGWYDALNGLPGIFASSTSETYSLEKLLKLLDRALANPDLGMVDVPCELSDFWSEIRAVISSEIMGLERWKAMVLVRERFREHTRYGLSGQTQQRSPDSIRTLLRMMQDVLGQSLDRLGQMQDGLPPTYLVFTPVIDQTETSKTRPLHERIIAYDMHPLPVFLEGLTKALVRSESREEARKFHAKVRQSGVFDSKLGMYKSNASLAEESILIGRTKAFMPGWLENESIFLHMHYKYLLSMLKVGLDQEFWETARQTLIPFHAPGRYGRSTRENVSFLVSSAHDDERLHGRGYVARLSGSTAEWVHMWRMIFWGKQGMTMDEEGLSFGLEPSLPRWLFDDQDTIKVRLMRHTNLHYHNPEKLDCFPGSEVGVISLQVTDHLGSVTKYQGNRLSGKMALALREGKRLQINAVIGRLGRQDPA